MKIKASDIESWAEKNIKVRSVLAVLLRMLIHNADTKINIKKINFPAHENSETLGWDGYLETDSFSAHIPEGISGWEFGVGEDMLKKANDDYKSRTEKISNDERQNITFIFVTPRNWKKKKKIKKHG